MFQSKINLKYMYRGNSNGNLVDWSLSSWEEQGINSKEEESMKDICEKKDTLDALLPRKFNMTGCINTCGKYGGTVTPIDSKEMQSAMYQDRHFREIAVEDVRGNKCEM